MVAKSAQKKSAPEKEDVKVSQFGRPRLLTQDAILDAAVELGLETLTMKKLASHLNVGTATLYQYFASRQALTRAAAVHMLSDMPLPQDVGQHWVVLSYDYVRVISDLLTENPHFLQSYQHSDYGFEVHFRLIEGFLETMVKRDFTPRDAMEVFNMVGMVAFARAVEKTRQREFDYFDETMASAAHRQFGRLDASRFPLTQTSLDVFTRGTDDKVQILFQSAVLAFAKTRGETEDIILSKLEESRRQSYGSG